MNIRIDRDLLLVVAVVLTEWVLCHCAKSLSEQVCRQAFRQTFEGRKFRNSCPQSDSMQNLGGSFPPTSPNVHSALNGNFEKGNQL